MTSLEPVKAAIAETRDASTLWTVREILNDWHVGDIDEASDQDVADGRDGPDTRTGRPGRRMKIWGWPQGAARPKPAEPAADRDGGGRE